MNSRSKPYSETTSSNARATAVPYTVEGEEIDPEELEDGTWGSLDPLDLQQKYSKAASKPAEARPEHASTSALHVQATRPPKLPRRRPMPRLPGEHYNIVIRPRHPINLANIGLAAILEAIQNTAKVDPARAEDEDQIRIHPIKNTITVTPDDSIRGVVYKAYTDETDHDFQAELMKKNPDIPIVNARRLGSSRHLLIALACFTLEVHPFRERQEACFNCRRLGHRTDVCPLPGPGTPKCRRCGGEHPPPPLGEKPTCTPQCVVCHGEHPTGSRSCKQCFAPVKPINKKKTSLSYSTNKRGRSNRSRSRERSTAKPAMNNKNAWSNGPPKNVARTTDVSGQTRKEATTQPAHNTIPARPQDIQVRELAELVKSLQQQLASANEPIRQLENNYNSTTTPPAPEEQVACAQSEVTDMETDRFKGEKRKASSPAPETVTEEKREKVKNSAIRIAKLETAINARFKELEAKQAEFQAATEGRLTRIEAAIQNMLTPPNKFVDCSGERPTDTEE
ncbi:hypothetical protein HPB49_006577 [Dermacentor silvarum]|uniref:Uncharacterized protein n=1 Tax=Dermacentor silvarum TaxID=543639 RepID=A0ACB8DAU3_DERSI|nr:hypothetical protein HPB49_006577 [Dermacentor silvarum]